MISSIQYRFDKNHNKWALLAVESFNSTIQVYVFNDAFEQYSHLLYEDSLCFFIGRDFNQNENETISRLVVDKIYPLDNIRDKLTKNINIKLKFSINQNKVLDHLEQLNKEHEGNYCLILHVESSEKNIQKILIKKLQFSVNPKSLLHLREIFGQNNVWLTI